jgi:predicted adenylyl cyclase CyaB
LSEVEVKILEINPAQIRKLLKQHKAKFVKKVFQRNTLYVNDYTKDKVVLRVREEGKNGVLTLKMNRRSVGGHKILDEYESPIEPKAAHQIFKLLGFKVYAINELEREYYRLGGCSVEICQLPKIPAYLEIEGTKAAIKKVATLFGYSEKDYESRTAFEIYKMPQKRAVFK